MVLNVRDIVPHCHTWQDGERIADLIRCAFRRGETVTVSFAGVDSVPSSFVNGAFVSLLDTYTFDHIRANLRVVDSTRQINSMIRDRFDFEVHRRPRRVA